jgi:hypothetical protein
MDCSLITIRLRMMLMQSSFSIVEREFDILLWRKWVATRRGELNERWRLATKNTQLLKINKRQCNKKTINETHLLKTRIHLKEPKGTLCKQREKIQGNKQDYGFIA